MFVRQLMTISGVAAGMVGGAVVGYINVYPVRNSWTTNSSPSLCWDWNWDRREPSSLMKPQKRNEDEKDDETPVKSSAKRVIILVRHGQYNLDGATDCERTLTKLGEEQARLTGQRLKDLDLPITRLVYSTMARARQTASIMMDNMNVIKTVESSDLIREGAPIPPEPPVGHWKPENYKFFTDGSRIEAGFREYFHRASPKQEEDSYEVIVCHANVIRYMVCRALQFPPEAWLRMSLHNGSITVLTIRPDGRVSIKQLGECGHMPPHSLSLT